MHCSTLFWWAANLFLRNNHTSANIEGSGRGEFGLENGVETRLSSEKISPNEKYIF